jgi:hypothetical protein
VQAAGLDEAKCGTSRTRGRGGELQNDAGGIRRSGEGTCKSGRDFCWRLLRDKSRFHPGPGARGGVSNCLWRVLILRKADCAQIYPGNEDDWLIRRIRLALRATLRGGVGNWKRAPGLRQDPPSKYEDGAPRVYRPFRLSYGPPAVNDMCEVSLCPHGGASSKIKHGCKVSGIWTAAGPR